MILGLSLEMLYRLVIAKLTRLPKEIFSEYVTQKILGDIKLRAG